MKLLLKIFLFLMVFQLQAQKAEIVVQAAHGGHINKALIDSEHNLMLTYGTFNDKTFRFWDLKTGTLLKKVDFIEYVNNFSIDKKNGKTYLNTSKAVIVYDNVTLQEVKRYPVGNLKNAIFSPLDGIIYLVTGQGDGNYVFSEMNPQTGAISKSTAQWPSVGYPQYVNLEANNSILSFSTEFLENVLYDPRSKQFIVLNNDHLAFFKNGDFLFVDIVDKTHVKVVRYSGFEKKSIWEKTIVIENMGVASKPYPGQVAFTPDGKGLWVAPGKSTLIELNPETGDVKGVIYTKTKKTTIIADNNFVYALERSSENLTAPGYYNKYKRYSANPITPYGFPMFSANTFSIFNSENELGFVFQDLNGNVGSFSSNAAGTQVIKYNTKYNQKYSLFGVLFPSSTSKNVFLGMSPEEGIKQLTRGDKDSFKNFFSPSKYKEKPIISTKKNVVLTKLENGFTVYDLNAKREVFSSVYVDVKRVVSSDVVFSETKDEMAFLLNDEIVFDQVYMRKIEYYNYTSKKRVWSKKGDYLQHFFIENDTKLLAINLDNKHAEILDISNGNVLRSFPLNIKDYGSNFTLNLSHTKLISSNKGDNTYVYDITSGKLLNQTPKYKESYFVNYQFITDDIYVLLANGAFTFHDLNTHEELLRLYTFLDGEWIAHTPEGLFDGSQNAWKRLVFVNGKETIPIDQIFNKFYTPRLFHKIISEEKVEKPEVDIDDLKKAPSVTISYKEGTRNLTVEDVAKVIKTKNPSAEITITANAYGDRISEIQLFHNDKRVLKNTRNLIVEDDNVSANQQKFNISLLEGENTFRAVALNSEKTESAPEVLYVNYTKPKEVKKDAHGIQVHLLVIGINDYKNPKYNLNYAVADANAFSQAVNKGISSMTSKVNTYIINNKDANRTKILETLEQINKTAKAQDIFLFYYAGHGVVTQDTSKEFFIVPYDVTQLYGAVESLRQKGISAKELKAIASAIPAQKQLYILDACQSAGALDAVASRGVVEEKAIAQLARSTGTHWLTASGSDQYATEFDELGHGVFTYALLEALSGKADSGDGRITVNELKAYIESRVPEISEKYKGSPQYPSSFGFGQDFPVSIKK